MPELPLVRFDVGVILAELLVGEFKDLKARPWWQFSTEKTLAFVRYFEDKEPSIHLHTILNNPGTPEEVIRFILKHELLHLRIRPREINGKMVGHPPEFWEEEKRISPESSRVWPWLMMTFENLIKRDEKAEKTLVRRMKKGDFLARMSSVDEIMAILHLDRSE